MLLPPDLRDWIREDDRVHFVISAVEGMDLSLFKVNVRGTGSAQYPPRMMLALLIYCYANDSGELVDDLETIPDQTGKPEKALADSGYVCEEQVQSVQDQGIEVYVATGAERTHQRRRHDFRPKHLRSEARKEPKAEWLIAMKEKLQTEEGRGLYGLRKQTVEPVFGIIKHCMGFRQFLLRGVEKVSGEWELVALAYNTKRLWNLKMAEA